MLRTDPIKDQFMNWLDRRIDEGKNGITDSRTGEIFTCPDDSIEKARNKLKEINFPELPENIKLFNPNDSKESVFLAFRRMWEFFISVLPFDTGKTNISLTLAEIIPLGGGILIDLLIFIVAPPQRTSSIILRRKSFLWFINKAFMSKTLLNEEVWHKLKKAIYLIRKYELRKGKRYYLVIPIDSKKDEHISIREMIDLLLSNKWVKLLGNVQKEKIDRWLKNNHPDLRGYVGKFTVYEMKPEIHQELILERRLWFKKETKGDTGVTGMAFVKAFWDAIIRRILKRVYHYGWDFIKKS